MIFFLFILLLREELTAFIRTHNTYPIRAQRNRFQYIFNISDDLYRADKQYGFALNE
jgi:hypothetical protein